MGDDYWSNDGDRVDSAYKTISSLRELVGPNRQFADGVSLKGTRFRRTRCAEDPSYFVSTPLERFKHTRQKKLEEWQKIRDKSKENQIDLKDYESFKKHFSSKLRSDSATNSPKAFVSKRVSFDDNAKELSEESKDCLKTVEETYKGSKTNFDTNESGLQSQNDNLDYDGAKKTEISDESTQSTEETKNRSHGGDSDNNVKHNSKSSVNTNSTKNKHKLAKSKAVDIVDAPTKYSSPDRFKVSKTELKTDLNSKIKENEDTGRSRLDKSNARTKETSGDRCNVESVEIDQDLLFNDHDEKVLPTFAQDYQNFRDHSPNYHDLSCPLPRRRLSQCPEEDETEDEPTKRPILPRLHMDKMFFDSSLVEIKSPASSTSTIDTLGSIDDIWVKRREQKTRQDVSGGSGDGNSTDGSTLSSTTSRASNDSHHSYRSDSTWGGGNPGRQMVALVTGRRHRSGGRHSVYHTVTGAVGGTGPPRVQQTHIPSIFEVFRPRSKSDANQKKPSLMGQVRNAMGGSGGKGAAVGDENLPNTSSSSSRGPVAKVMHLFRNRSQSAASADEKRKARALALQQQQQQYAASVIRRNSLDKRRLSLGPVGGTGHRGSDPSLDPNHAAILFRDSRGLPVADPFLEKVNLSDLEEDESQIFVKFFRFHKCYDLIPTSAKLVVFDTQLLVKKAFFALVYNGVRAAPLWDSVQHKFVGMLTITDFIKILKMYYGKNDGSEWLQEMEAHKLDTWRKVLKDEARELVSIEPDASLFDAISMLVQHKIHRLPVVDLDTNNVLYILTHKRILRFLFLYIKDLPRPSYMDKTLAELRVGTFNDVATAKQETTIINALDVFMERRVSALPIVDQDNKLLDIYAKFDVINLAAEKTYDNLDVSLKEANEHRNDWFEGVHKCSMDDTLYTIIERIVRAEVHRLVVTDDEDRVIGVISLSDILEYLVLRPSRDEVLCRSESPSVSESLAYSQTQEDTIIEGEEDEERERSPQTQWSQPQWSIPTTAPLTSA